MVSTKLVPRELSFLMLQASTVVWLLICVNTALIQRNITIKGVKNGDTFSPV